MKQLALIFIVASLFTINGCARKAYSGKASAPPPVAAEKPQKQTVFTAEDLKIQRQNSPIKKYNGLSLREARQAQSAAQRGQSNSAGTIKSGSVYQRRNPM